jgi:hypothetical protein
MEAALDYDFFITEKTFVWGGALAEKDGMADLDVRFVGGGGLGYQWIEEDDLKFNTRAGMTWVSENYSDLTDDESYIGARLGYRLDYKFWEDFGLFNVTDWIASLESRYDQLVKSSAGLRIYFITELYGEARVDWEWDSSPAQNANRHLSGPCSLHYSFYFIWSASSGSCRAWSRILVTAVTIRSMASGGAMSWFCLSQTQWVMVRRETGVSTFL